MAAIQISTNPDGTLTWETDGVFSGVACMSMLSHTIMDMYAYYFEQPARPPLPEQDMRVCIEMKNDTMAISYQPTADPDTAMALCHAAFCALHNKMLEDGFDPLEGVLGALKFKDDT
jgi:hypothetical protein